MFFINKLSCLIKWKKLSCLYKWSNFRSCKNGPSFCTKRNRLERVVAAMFAPCRGPTSGRGWRITGPARFWPWPVVGKADSGSRRSERSADSNWSQRRSGKIWERGTSTNDVTFQNHSLIKAKSVKAILLNKFSKDYITLKFLDGALHQYWS